MKIALYILAIIAVVSMIIRTIPHAEASTRLTLANHRAYDRNQLTEEVSFNLLRVQRDPGGAIGWRQLASAYLAAGREKDSADLAKKAEAAAEQSLKIRSKRNGSAAVILSEALLEQHRFTDALNACMKSLELEPENDFAERTLTDIYFEIGRYGEARKLIGKHPEWSEDPSGLALFARQQELTGHPDQAVVSLSKATELAESEPDLPAPTVSWFHIKLGDLLARTGDLTKAEAHYLDALKMNSGSWKALASMARLKAMQKDFKDVIAYGSKLNEIAPMTDVVGLMEDASKSLGDQDSAQKYTSQVLAMNKNTIDAGTNPASELDMKRGHTHDRMFSMYLADHNRMLALAQHAATHDLASRKDIYAYDTYAWSTFRMATFNSSVANTTDNDYRLIEVKQCIDKALALGTKDAKLLYHAGMIEVSLHQNTQAKLHFQQAIDINPSIVPDAKSELAKL
jgi:tetratricopeptide (TPR) repeat protein